MKRAFSIIALAMVWATGTPVAIATSHQASALAAGNMTLADGEVRKVDREAKKITIRHGPIPNLDMPPMTMVFQVRDGAVLDNVKAGDRIRFAADKTPDAYVVTRIERAK